MFKKLITYLFFLFVIFSEANSEIIKDVLTTGNKRISLETIIVLGDIKVGENYNDNILNNITKRLYDSGFFKDIELEIKNNSLYINLEEFPIIENIEIRGVKNENLIQTLLDNIKLKRNMSYSDNQLEYDLISIDNILKSYGYYFSEIKTSVLENKELNSINLNIDLNLNDKARINKITFIGDKKIKDKKLLEVIVSEEHKFWKFISKKVYLNQAFIDLDKRLLENFYKNQGYYNVKVLNSFAELKGNKDFNLIFNIDSGKKFYFNNFKLNLPSDYNSEDFGSLNRIFDDLSGNTYSLDKFNLILDEIDKIASTKLYDFIDAKVEEEILDNNKINFTFNVIEADKFYVERINILGNFQTIEEVIRNKFIVDEGDPLNNLLLNKSIDNIKSLGIFKKVNTDIKDGSGSNYKVIDIILEEQPTGEISLGAGTGTSGTTIGGGINEKNFLGKGINLNSNLEISDDGLRGSFIYSKPNFAYTDNTLFTSLSALKTDNLSDFGYEVSKKNLSIGTRFEQFENLFFNPEISLTNENLKTNSSASTQYKKQEGTYNDLMFNYRLNYDKRNSSYNPSSGNISTFYQSLPMVSDSKDITNTFSFTQFKQLSENRDMIGKASLYFKAVNSLDNSVRVSNRGYVPYNRLRGFEKGKVGPVDNNDYVGGNYVSALNLSTTLPNLIGEIENIDFNYFIDAANVWGVDYDKSIDDSNKIRSSTGVGLNLLTPIGPLSFSYSVPITKTSTDKTENFRFNIGTTF